MEESKRNTTLISHPSFSIKNKQKKPKNREREREREKEKRKKEKIPSYDKMFAV